jgi:hypothetical protein
MSGLRVDAVRVSDHVPFSINLDIELLKVQCLCVWVMQAARCGLHFVPLCEG